MYRWYDEAMNNHEHSSRSASLANFFGALGYISVIIQWAWSLIVVAYPLLASGACTIVAPPPATNTPEPLDLGAATPFVTVIAVFVTLLVMIATVIFVAKLPKTIGKSGARATHTVAHKLTPHISHSRKLTKKQRRTISYRIVLIIKLCIIVTPLVLLGFAHAISTLSLEIIWTVAIFCAVCSLVYFAVQQLVALARGVARDVIW